MERSDEGSEVNDRIFHAMLSRATEPLIAPASTRTSCFPQLQLQLHSSQLSRRDIHLRDDLATPTLSQPRTSAQNTFTMPPKKAKTKAKAVVKTSTRSTATTAPPTVVMKSVKEYDTTAAAARPRRATAPTPSVPIKAPAKSNAISDNALSLYN
jgi:hypothetical protein